MKETKIKTSSLSLTLEPGNKILVRSIIFLLSEKTRTEDKRWAVFNNNLDFDDSNHDIPRAFGAGKLNMPKNDFHSRQSTQKSFVSKHGKTHW